MFRLPGAELESLGLDGAFDGSYAPSIVLGNKLAAPLVQVLQADKCCLGSPKCSNLNSFESSEGSVGS